MPDRKAVVTGAAGFIASHLIAELEAGGWQVTAVDSRVCEDGRPTVEADIRDAAAMFDLMMAVRPDAVFNMAGVLGRDDPAESLRACIEVNLMGAMTVLRAAAGAGASRVVLMGSAEELGEQPGPHTEDMATRPLSPYGISKAAMTWMARATHRASGSPAVVMRPTTVYGPRQPRALFVSQAVHAAAGGQRFEMSAGTQRRDMVFVSDVVRALAAAATAPDVAGEIINVASGQPRALRDVAARIWELSGTEAELVVGAIDADQAQKADTWGDPSKAERLLSWSAETGIDEGLLATIEAARSA
ncbi:MAG: NAD-dependent epimerase/dehydratase family protein [Deltaproteobacteria bacterium]